MTVEIIRRLRGGGILGETVHAWHHEHDGAGEPGGRTYAVLYAPEGQVRIDVSGCWSSTYHTLFLKPDEIRPQEEYIEHLIAAGQTAERRAYCWDCGREKPDGLMGSCPEGCRAEPPRDPEW